MSDTIGPNTSEELRRALSQLRDLASDVANLRDSICGATPTVGAGSGGQIPPPNGWADDMRTSASFSCEAGARAFKDLIEIRAAIGI